MDHDVGRAEQVEAAGSDETRITGTTADQVHRPGLLADRRQQPGPESRRGRRRVPARQVDHDVLEPRVGAHGLVDDEALPADASLQRRRAGWQADEPRNVFQSMSAATDQERHDEHLGKRDPRDGQRQRRVVVDERGDHVARHAPAPERLGKLLGGGSAVRVPPGPVPHDDECHRLPLGVLPAQQLGHPARHQRGHARVSADRRAPAEPHFGRPPVPRQRLGQHHLAEVARAGEERHDRHLVGGQLVEHRVESRLPLVECRGHLVEQAAAAERLRQPPDQCVGGRIPPRAVRREHQGAGHGATSSGTSSMVGSSRPVTTVRAARRPRRRW